MSDKKTLHLSISSDITDLAKTSGLNLSKEFEEWIRIRLNQNDINQPIVDIDLEIAKHNAEIQKLKNQEEIQKQKKSIEEEKDIALDNIINNMKKFKEDMTNISDVRCHGVQFIFKKKFNINLNNLEAKELLEKRIKEKELDGEGTII